jgi:integral membrane protein
MKTNQKLLNIFRKVAIAEGISFLVLLLIAMPLKYLADLPLAVKVVGWAHGILFIGFLALSYEVKTALGKNFLFLVKAFIASILPFGTFWLEKQMRKDGDFSEVL